MSKAKSSQKFQDWFTQQWVILWGKKIESDNESWLLGPYGKPNVSGEDFISILAEDLNLKINRNVSNHGLISSIEDLSLDPSSLAKLSKEIIHFYENTGCYRFKIDVNWNPIFRVFGRLVSKLFSSRINQLNIPTMNFKDSAELTSEIISLNEPDSNQTVYTFWLRKIKNSGAVVYSGIYTITKIPTGESCVKAIFPLPNGNATVILKPTVSNKGELILNSSGRKFGDAGFYFLLHDSEDQNWSQYLRSFRDQLTVFKKGDQLYAEQKLTLWHFPVVRFKYELILK